MNWAAALNSPTFAGPLSTSLKIFGSLSMNPSMNMTFTGNISFESSLTGNTIKSGGKLLKSDVYFNGAGEWTLLDPFSCLATLHLDFGIFNTNNQSVTLRAFDSNVKTSRRLILGSSQVDITGGGSNAFVVDFTGLIFTAGTSTISFTATSPAFIGFKAVAAPSDIAFYNVAFTGGGITDSSSNNTGFLLKFNKLFLAGNGRITGNNFCDTLSLTEGSNYIFQSGSTQYMNNLLIPNTSCGDYTSFYSSTGGSFATFSKTNGAVNVDDLILQDIHASGGAFWSASNSLAISNTNGWNITSALSSGINYFWVNGNGNWSSLQHWSNTSGGPANMSCLPGPGNNVIFDNNSFSSAGQMVTIDVNSAYCNSFTWTNNALPAKLYGIANKTLKIFGSLSLSTSLAYNFLGQVDFEASSIGNTITSAGALFKNSVNFFGLGSWTLLDAFNCNSTLNFQTGTLITNDKPVHVNIFNSNTTSIRALFLGNTLLTVSSGTYGFTVDFMNLNFNAGTSTLLFNYDSIGTPGILSYFAPANIQFYNVKFTGPKSDANILNVTGKQFLFNDVSFACSATVNGNNQYNGTLSLSPGMFYTFQGSRTQLINGTILANGSCGNVINIQSSYSGSPAIFKKASGTIDINYVIINYVNASGGATWNASNSDNIFSSTGWTITSLPNSNIDYYWIGHDKYWSNPLNWSFTSGGSPNVSGCIPEPSNNVIFDDHSFPGNDTVFFDIPQTSCNNMTWSVTLYHPVLSGNALKSLHIYGSLNVKTTLFLSFPVSVYFESSNPGNIVKSGSSNFQFPVYFNGAGGTWSLSDSLTCLNRLYFFQGNLITNNNSIRTAYFFSVSSSNRTLSLGSSVITITAGSPKAFYIYGANYQINSGTSVLKFINNNGYTSGIYVSNTTLPVSLYDVTFTGANSTGVIENTTTQIINYHNVAYYGKGIINGANNFGQAVFYNEGFINDNNTFGILTFTPGNTYVLESGSTQTILSYLWLQGTCTTYMLIMSSLTGSLAYIVKNVGKVLGFNIHIRDINFTGQGFIAYNSIDLGGNTRILFETLPSFSTLQAINGAISVCEGSSAVYYIPSISGAIYYNWIVPPGTTIISGQGDTLVTIQFDVASTYELQVEAFNGCSYTSPISYFVTVHASPNADAGANQAICLGSTTTLTATGGGTYLWNNGSTNAIISVNPLTTSTYAVTVTDVVFGCSAKDSVIVTVEQVIATASSPKSICQKDPVQLNASGGTSYVWSPASTLNNPNISDPIAMPMTTTTYNVTVSDSLGCFSTAQVVITVVPLPTNAGLTDTSVCFGSFVSLHAKGGTTYQWSDGSTSSFISVSPTVNTVYTVTVANGACSASSDVTVAVLPLPTATISADIYSGCVPLTVKFSCIEPTSVTSNDWQFGDGTTATGNAPPHTYTVPGTFNVTLTITDSSGCSNTVSLPRPIIVYPKPEIDFTWVENHTKMSYYDIAFTSSSPVTLPSMNWNFGDTNTIKDTSSESDPHYVYPIAGTYNVSLWVENQYGCADTVSHEVTVYDQSYFYIPNSFTPNNDGKNDNFYPVFNNTPLTEYSFVIYDRWGSVVFQTNQVTAQWDGNEEGGAKHAPDGVYPWVIVFKSDQQVEQVINGTVTLLK